MFFGSQGIAVILAVFLHHANGRTITSTSNDNIGRMLDLAEEELNTVLNETNEDPTEREENPADVLRLSEPDSSSYEVFSSDSIIQRKEASPVLRHKISRAGPCYSGTQRTVKLETGGLRAFPICEKVSLTGCGSSIPKYGMRKCKGSHHLTVSFILNEAILVKAFPTKCSCAVRN